jgi:nicotinate dehydrogenase subunit B
MPGFRDSLTDKQIVELIGFIRGRFAANQPAWQDVPQAISRVRGAAP